jgi:hypothetical protein
MSGVVMRGVTLVDVDIYGEIGVNGGEGCSTLVLGGSGL